MNVKFKTVHKESILILAFIHFYACVEQGLVAHICRTKTHEICDVFFYFKIIYGENMNNNIYKLETLF